MKITRANQTAIKMALLVSACGFTEPRKFIVMKESRDIDGSFLISSLIGQRLRQQSVGIVLVCCHQTLKYYDTCGKKLGYNLTMSVAKKCLHAIEPPKDMLTLTEDALIARLLEDICGRVDLLREEGKKNITVMIDDLAFFTNLGCSEKKLIKLGLKLHALTQGSELSVAIKIGLSDLHELLTNNLEDCADVVLSVEKLKSGDFWDVDGKLKIRKSGLQGEVPGKESERSLLYFIGDHNVKLTAPGEFGLKV